MIDFNKYMNKLVSELQKKPCKRDSKFINNINIKFDKKGLDLLIEKFINIDKNFMEYNNKSNSITIGYTIPMILVHICIYNYVSKDIINMILCRLVYYSLQYPVIFSYYNSMDCLDLATKLNNIELMVYFDKWHINKLVLKKDYMKDWELEHV